MPVTFEIEFVSKDRRPYYLVARQIIAGQDFSVIETPFLNGSRLKPELTSPRAVDSNGSLRLDLFVFRFFNGSDIKKFTKGMIVELTDKEI